MVFPSLPCVSAVALFAELMVNCVAFCVLLNPIELPRRVDELLI